MQAIQDVTSACQQALPSNPFTLIFKNRAFEIRKYPTHSSLVRSALPAGDSRREIRRFRSECCGDFCPIR